MNNKKKDNSVKNTGAVIVKKNGSMLFHRHTTEV